MSIQDKNKALQILDEQYRTGDQSISDEAFDLIADGGDSIRSSARRFKHDLPVPMFSLDKKKEQKAIDLWKKSLKIKGATFVATPKYDGIAICVKEKIGRCWTAGDGLKGERVDAHVAFMQGYNEVNRDNRDFFISSGEAIMKRSTFEEKYAGLYETARNMVGGLFNTIEISEALRDVVYVRYNFFDDEEPAKFFLKKSEELDLLNAMSCCAHKVPYVVYDDVPTLLQLDQLYKTWRKELDFELDGIAIDVNEPEFRAQLGRKRDGNPRYAIAFKGANEEKAVAKVKAIHLQVSRRGMLKPVVEIEPTKLDGVTITRVTGNNLRFLLEAGINVGAEVEVIRSGMVIPKIVNVVSKQAYELPTECPSCKCQNLKWTKTFVDYMCTNDFCKERMESEMQFFAKTMSIDLLGLGVISKIYDAGVDSVAVMLQLEEEDWKFLNGSNGVKIYEQLTVIKNTKHDFKLLCEASGCFDGVGRTILESLPHWVIDPEARAEPQDLVNAMENVSELRADVIIDGLKDFWRWLSNTGLSFNPPIEQLPPLYTVVFTGFRDASVEVELAKLRVKVKKGMTSDVTHVICKDASANSGKIEKAKKDGKQVLTLEQFMLLLETNSSS